MTKASKMKRILTSSSDGPYVFIEADPDGVDFLHRVAAYVSDDAAKLGLRSVTIDAPAKGLAVRCASRLQPGDDAGWERQCDPPCNDQTCLLPGFRLHRMTVTTTSVWFLLIDDSDKTHLPEFVRSDDIDLGSLR